MPTKTQTTKCKTPFGQPKWEWNWTPQNGVPDRKYCQSIVTPEEKKAGEKLLADYRTEEAVSAKHDIDARQTQLDQLRRTSGDGGHGVERERIRRELSQCDHAAFEASQAKLVELRTQAFELAKPVLVRLIENFNANLEEAALAGEQRLEKVGLPIRNGDSWMMHHDCVCQMFWSCRRIAEKTLAELEQHRDGIGAIQELLTSEEHTPFNWVL
jgi:hypothetical protein